MYKKAAQLKLRVPTTIGNLSVEQLFTLPIKDDNKPITLTNIAVQLHTELTKTSASGLDFLDTSVRVDELTQLRFDIVKDIILTKQSEANAKTNEKARKQEIELLESLLAKKQALAMEGLSAEELERKIKELQEKL